MLLTARSDGYRKAFAAPTPGFEVPRRPWVRAEELGSTADGYREEGVVDCGGDGGEAPPLVEVRPYLFGPPGEAFWLMLTGWRRTAGDANVRVWVGSPLAVFYCVSGDIPGPPERPGRTSDPRGVSEVRAVADHEYFAESMVLTAGSLGRGHAGGEIVQFGAGSGIPALARVPTWGVQKLQFEFARAFPQQRFGMNALWAWCS